VVAEIRDFADERERRFSGETFHRNLEDVDRLKKVAEEKGATLPELAVAWTLAHPAVHVAIVGARPPLTA
jgi:aryl-alcohol dehydrogenase-like predicted oxidoreductase